ncbi:MAG TPA: hypothetical protein PKN04_15250 [bacterium]|nr:hypothetical protein [bacterium]HNT67139.1 hypothetical protein [bacterium]
MEGSGLPEFDHALQQLTQDLAELETVSQHLENIKGYAADLKKFDVKFETSLQELKTQANSLLQVLNKTIAGSKEGLEKNISSLSVEIGKLSSLNEASNLNIDTLSKAAADLSTVTQELALFNQENQSSKTELANLLEKYHTIRSTFEQNLSQFLQNNKKLDDLVKESVRSSKSSSQSILESAEKIDSLVSNTKTLVDDFFKVDQQITQSVKTISDTLSRISHIDFPMQFGRVESALRVIYQQQQAQSVSLQSIQQVRQDLQDHGAVLQKIITTDQEFEKIIAHLEESIHHSQEDTTKHTQQVLDQLEKKLLQTLINHRTEMEERFRTSLSHIEDRLIQSLQKQRSEYISVVLRENEALRKRLFVSEIIIFCAALLITLVFFMLIR